MDEMIFAALHVLFCQSGRSFEREEPRYLQAGVESGVQGEHSQQITERNSYKSPNEATTNRRTVDVIELNCV